MVSSTDSVDIRHPGMLFIPADRLLFGDFKANAGWAVLLHRCRDCFRSMLSIKPGPSRVFITRGDPMNAPKGRRDWRRIHHSPMFWIGIALCLSAIGIYVLSDSLSWLPFGKGR